MGDFKFDKQTRVAYSGKLSKEGVIIGRFHKKVGLYPYDMTFIYYKVIWDDSDSVEDVSETLLIKVEEVTGVKGKKVYSC